MAMRSAGLASDDTTMIQALIDSTPNTTAILPPGVYHISTPLRVGNHGNRAKYLVGAGMDQTFVFAMNDSIAMVVGAGDGNSYHFHVAGLTLAGGRYGIHWSSATAGLHAQITESVLSHVLFANFSVAAIFADNIYGVDNNMFSDLTFTGCALAFHQRAPDSQRKPTGECLAPFDNAEMGYMDKVFWWRNRVIGGGGFLMEPCRYDIPKKAHDLLLDSY
jgi:hypothetical protein